MRNLLDALENAIRRHNPVLAGRLVPGLSPEKTQKILRQFKVAGNVRPIVELFSWKDGTNVDPSVERKSLFPQSPFMFVDLEMMASHFRELGVWAKYQQKYRAVAGKYFPLFWNGSTKWIALDLNPQATSQVVLIDGDNDPPVTTLYARFEDLVQSAIDANNNQTKLNAFE